MTNKNKKVLLQLLADMYRDVDTYKAEAERFRKLYSSEVKKTEKLEDELRDEQKAVMESSGSIVRLRAQLMSLETRISEYQLKLATAEGELGRTRKAGPERSEQ